MNTKMLGTLKKIGVIFFFSLVVSFFAAAAEKNWWMDTSVYHVYIDSFCDSDNDGHGDLNGVRSKLDYFQKLGIKTIWLSPIMKSMDNHGYNVVDYYDIDPDFGTMQDFDNLIRDAHALGIRVINDMVANHTGTLHEWFSSEDASKRKDHWYVWSSYDKCWDDPWNHNAGTGPQHAGKTWVKDPFDWLDRDGNGDCHDDDYYYSLFADENDGEIYYDGKLAGIGGTMPDLNYNDPVARAEIVAELKAIMSFWFNKGLDGFRVDACRYLIEDGPGKQADEPGTHRIWRDLRCWLDENFENKILLGEGPTETQGQLLGYYGFDVDTDGNATDTWLGDEYHTAFHFTFQNELTGCLTDGLKSGSFFNTMYAIQGEKPENCQDTIFLSNHDAIFGERVATQMGRDEWKMKAVANLYLLLSGNPTIYYGEELGLANVPIVEGENVDNRVRGKVDWNTVAAQESDSKSLLNHYRNVLNLRMSYDALRSGISFFVPSKYENGAPDSQNSPSNRMALVREYYGEKILVVHTFGMESGNVFVDLSETGLEFANENAYVLMDYDETKEEWTGRAQAAPITAANVSNYPVGYMYGKTTTVIFLGNIDKYTDSEGKFPYYGYTGCPDPRPEAPSNVTPESDESTISLHWSHVEKADFYNIYYTDDGTDPTKNCTKISTTECHYTFTGFTAGVEYKFALTSENDYGESGLSEIVAATIGTGDDLKIHIQDAFGTGGYILHTWGGLTGEIGSVYEGEKYDGRQWWLATAANVPDSFSFTIKDENGRWEGNAGQYDRTYNKKVHGKEIWVIPGDPAIYTEPPQPAKKLTIHLLEWESCFGTYTLHAWSGLTGDFDLECEGYKTYAGRSGYWWKVEITDVPDSFWFTFKNSNGNWEGSAGAFDRNYVKSQYGEKIYIIGKDKNIYK